MERLIDIGLTGFGIDGEIDRHRFDRVWDRWRD